MLSATAAPPLCAILEEAGLTPRIDHDLETFAASREALGDPRWSKLAEPCDPNLNPDATPADTFVVYATNPAGDLWGCAASRLRWIEGSLAGAIADQTVLAERPERLPGGQRFGAFGGALGGIRDVQIAWGSSLWAHDKAPRILVPAIMRLLHLWTFAHWRWSYTVSIGQPRIADRYGLDVHGYDLVARGARRTMPEGTTTDYRLMIAGRERIRALVADPGFVDLGRDLSTLGG
ncbi:MAG: hypothetical protein NBV67_06200 [Tagaea sp.]|nr:hypothetical protein [Tagaea sp.]